MEHRWGNRLTIDLKVQMFVDPASTAWGKLRDISVSGGFLETRLKVAVLSTLRMTVPGDGAAQAREVRAIVVRKDADGVGVEWFDGDCDIVARLIRETRTWHSPAFVTEQHHDYLAGL